MSYKAKIPYKPLNISRLFREWYAMDHLGFADIISIWRDRGESEDEIDKAKKDLADIFNGAWITKS